ncbi:MAG: CopG family antitoxin [Chloroflexi bacterium]|nr:CopG family antitoxin [Chloroflexota bacterium]
MPNQNGQPRRIPTFASVEEAAEFWDTHSFEEFADELEEVDELQFLAVRSERRLAVNLKLDVARELREQASDEGITPAELVMRWIEERLRKQAS